MTAYMNQHETSLAAALQQYFTNSSASQDAIMLMPIIQLPAGKSLTCQIRIDLDNGTEAVCNTPTDVQCPGCGCFVCEDHQSPCGMLLTSDAGEEHAVPLCDNCALLPVQTVCALRAFRLSMSLHEGQGLP